MDDDFINWTPEHCKTNIHEWQKTKDEELFSLLLAKYDRFLVKLAWNFYDKFCGRVSLEDLYHTAIIGFGKAISHFKQHTLARLIMAEIKAYVKSEIEARYKSELTLNPVGLMADSGDEINLEARLNADFIMNSDFLSKEDKELLEMKFYQRMTFKEIGQTFGITEQGASQRYRRIRSEIRKKIKPGELAKNIRGNANIR